MRQHHRLSPAWRRMLSPARYLLVQHQAKRAFDYGWPLTLTIVTVIVFAVLPVQPPILGDKGFLKDLQTLIGLLAAFFVAALAAVSTVERQALDAPMLGDPPKLNGKSLSRRQFVCLLFGYLSLVSFGLVLMAVAAGALVPSFHFLINPKNFQYLRLVLGAAYTFVFWNMLTTTLLGIWFLVERVPMHISDNTSPDVIEGLRAEPAWRPEGVE